MGIGIRIGLTGRPVGGDQAAALFKNAPSLYYSASALPGQVVFEKRRSDFNEWAVYTPLTTNGTQWARWFFSDRLATIYGLDGGLATLAYLWRTTDTALFGSNSPSGLTAVTPTVDQATTSATARTGSWTAASTISGKADVRYSTTAGDSVTYRVTVPAGGRIYLDSTTNVNGGIADILINQVSPAAEIAAGEYLVTSKQLDTRRAAVSNTGVTFPLAEVIDAGDYDVRITVAASNPAGGRIWESGIKVTGPVGFNEVGIHGGVGPSTSGGLTSDYFLHSGTVAVYYLENVTRIAFRYYQVSLAGIVDFKVFNSSGVEIDAGDYLITSRDMYGAGAANTQALIAEGLTRGDYYLHVRLRNTKNASSTDFRCYAHGARGWDETTGGTPGVDAFENNSMPNNPSTATDLGTHVISGGGNFVHASSWRSAASSPGAQNFVTGVHLFETDLRIGTIGVGGYTIKMDGTTLDYAALAVGAYTVGSELQVTFSTTVQTPDNSVGFATFARDWRFNRRGWTHSGEFVTTADAYLHIDYILMVQTPNGGNTRSDSVGPLNTVWTDEEGVSYLQDQSDNSDDVEPASVGFVHAGAGYAVYGVLEGGNQIPASSLLRDLTSDQLKSYLLETVADPVNGVLMPAGTVLRTRKSWRVLEGAFVP
jgi:hypothetical protein